MHERRPHAVIPAAFRRALYLQERMHLVGEIWRAGSGIVEVLELLGQRSGVVVEVAQERRASSGRATRERLRLPM